MVVHRSRWLGAGLGGLFVLMAAMLLFARPAKATIAVVTWKGGTGNWNTAANWSPGVIPKNGTPAGTTYKVVIDNKPGITSVVTMDVPGGAAVDEIRINTGDTLTVPSGQTLTVAG